MADRTSASLFAMMFQSIADQKPLDAETLWEMSQNYDFRPCQMSCDAALEKLGLLWVCRSPQCLKETDDYGRHVYGLEKLCDECGQHQGEET